MNIKRRIDALERQRIQNDAIRVFWQPHASLPARDNTLERQPDGSYADVATGQPFTGTVIRVEYAAKTENS